MSQELTKLANAALDDFYAISRLQELLEISIEQLDQPTENIYLRLELLIDSYQAYMALYLDELKSSLERIRNHAKELVEEASQVSDISNPFQI